MKIISLTAENVKRLVAIHIEPTGNMVEITGKNGQGKTSVLDAIWWALDGGKNIQSQPVRNGEEKAMIRLDLGDLVVTRKFIAHEGKPFTTSLIVENSAGARFQSPQAMLDDLLGNLTFDPLAFTNMKPGEQLDMLKAFVPDFDFAAAEKANKDDFAKRTDENRAAKQAMAQAEGVELPEEVPVRIDEAALVESMSTAANANTERQTRIARREAAQNDVVVKGDEAARLRTEAERLQTDMDDLKKKIETHYGRAREIEEEAAALQAKIENAAPLPDEIDLSDIQAQIAEAKNINAIADKADQKAAYLAEHGRHATEADKLTQAMDDRKDDMVKAVKSAKLPVDGIEFAEDCILMNGVPFDQASDAEQLRASIAIAMAMNPKLKVIRVRDGSLLDEDAMKLLAEIADANDYQVWIERVDSSGTVGFVIEDGHLKGDEIPQEDAA